MHNLPRRLEVNVQTITDEDCTYFCGLLKKSELYNQTLLGVGMVFE